MADFEGRTTSNIVKINDVESVEKLINEYEFGYARPEIIPESGLAILGYSWFNANKQDGEELEEDRTIEFLCRLSKFIADGETLEIQMIGGEKLRFPFSACSISVSKQNRVLTKCCFG